jgi:hypothetical protein
MEINPDFASPCGLYCGVCAIYIAHRDNNEKLKQGLVNLYKGKVPGKGALPNCEDLSTEDIKCGGCLSDEPFMHCLQCEIRNCTKEKGYTGCHECNEFPCIMRAVPYRREVGTEKWMQDEEARYVCPECSNKVFRGVIKCNKCKAGLDLD